MNPTHSAIVPCLLVFLLSSSYLSAQDSVAETAPAASDGSQTDQASKAASDAETSRVLEESLRSMFQEKQSPLLHIRWGTKIYVDVPFGNEPEGASPVLRKAELKLSRAFGKNFQVKLSGNYNHGEFKAGDSYLVYSGWKKAILTSGIQDPPFSLESSTTSAATSFMENALPVAALSENKNAGIDFLRRTSNSIFNANWVFYNPRVQGVSETGQALVARYVYSPINFHGRKNFHVGGSLSYRKLSNGAEVEFKSRPEVATADVYYIDTGDIDNSRKVLRSGLEATQIKGRFSWQTEVLASQVVRGNADTVRFWGAYFHLSQFLTNDSRNYDQGSGTFANLVPNSPVGRTGGWGAFELAFRASYADLSDKDIIGGRQSNLSLGLNWYLNEKLRLMANMVKVLDVDRPGSEYDDLDPMIYAMRAQWLIY
jgi:phosphate-selective porin OprO/OprP